MRRIMRKSAISPPVVVERISPKNAVPYRLSRSKRKTAVIRVNADGVVCFSAPVSFSLTHADHIIDSKHDWIIKRKSSLSQKIPIPSCKEGDRFLQAKRIRDKAFYYISCYEGKKPVKIFVRFSKTSWGSCSSLGNISLNGYLAYLPDELFEYVLFHELSHLYYMNHSNEFWRQLESLVPDPKILRKKLSQYILPR